MNALVGLLAAAIDCIVYPILYVWGFDQFFPTHDEAFRMAFYAMVCSAVMLVVGGLWLYWEASRKITLFIGILLVPLTGLVLMGLGVLVVLLIGYGWPVITTIGGAILGFFAIMIFGPASFFL